MGKTVQIRMSDDMYDQIRRRARARDLSISEYVRDMLALEEPPRTLRQRVEALERRVFEMRLPMDEFLNAVDSISHTTGHPLQQLCKQFLVYKEHGDKNAIQATLDVIAEASKHHATHPVVVTISHIVSPVE